MNLRQLVERSDRPFATQPQVNRYFPASSVEDARRRLARSIERGDGPGVVIGAAGIGKSLLLQVLAAQYREQFDVVLLASAQLCTRRALLQSIHFELGLDYHRRDEGELRLSLLDTLLSGDEATQGLLLLVDEAQSLAVHLLEELRLLTNLSRGGAPRVRLVVAGLPALEEKLASPELQSFTQRLAARCYVAPMTRAETTQYVRAQLAASSVDADRLFAAPAYDSLFTASDGVPRVVNQVCDRALEMAASRGMEKIDAASIQAAWADLQQLPTAWESPRETSSSEAIASSSMIVEFGSLSDAPASDPSNATPSAPTTKSASATVATQQSEPDPIASPTPLVVRGPVPAQPVHLPRVFTGPVQETVDPFAETFEEEELVLDSFATLASIFGTRAPRVQNRREPSLSQLVQSAINAVAIDASETPADIDAMDLSRPIEREPLRPAIRLAVVKESPPAARAVETPPPNSASDEPMESILVIEDDPEVVNAPLPGVRRENYRQLFSRLRHGA